MKKEEKANGKESVETIRNTGKERKKEELNSLERLIGSEVSPRRMDTSSNQTSFVAMDGNI
jgi:hypothetical protein